MKKENASTLSLAVFSFSFVVQEQCELSNFLIDFQMIENFRIQHLKKEKQKEKESK